ncbi:CAAX prenyl protease 2 putative peptidase with unknown catalytic mechanism (family U48) [Leptomonas seymouri]|uniref:intramembrane prenyl-peptidase Rce1 n=1 Tax=Leptomonas seymouri TaxID=5684 RepID=A0A0N1HYS3_LEPSE|nr:CAAX prenyl protease 2 putative peptidase with unknown catalytic mechanism (family U48) [Leptomonas seymouri]|eukprot:KPI82992.1 CAAX prenyl protease 2 putative peptidase with unknown catalytic mechanism (family U48) [Leptomonas seymouri]
MDYLICTGASFAFIASFYMWPQERRFMYWGIRSLRIATEDSTIYIDRDSDDTIRRRTISFLQICALSSAFLASRSVFSAKTPPSSVRGLLLSTGRAATSALVLFTGPLVDKVALREFVVEESWLRRWRTYFLCPIGEELFFRGTLFALLSRRSHAAQIGVAALLFALSHSHHVVSWACEEYIDRSAEATVINDADLQRTCWRAAARKLAFVYVFTGAFGALSGYYYLHICEGSISAIAVVHAICNVIGPPTFAVLRSPSFSPLMKLVSATAYVSGVAGWMLALLH